MLRRIRPPLAGDVFGVVGPQATLYGVLVQSVLTMIGFGIVVYSLYRE